VSVMLLEGVVGRLLHNRLRNIAVQVEMHRAPDRKVRKSRSKAKLETKPIRSTVQGNKVAESVQSREAEEKLLRVTSCDISRANYGAGE